MCHPPASPAGDTRGSQPWRQPYRANPGALPSLRSLPPPSALVWAGQADATVLLDGERGRYYTLNQVAGRMWELLVAGEPLIEILNCLGEEFEVADETLQADVDARSSLCSTRA